MLLLYSLSPFVLLKSAGDLRFQTVIRHDMAGLAGLGGFDARLSLGTNPTRYGPDHLLVMAHKFQMVDGERLYFHWALLLDRRTLLPTRISSAPIFVGGHSRADHRERRMGAHREETVDRAGGVLGNKEAPQADLVA